MSNRRSKLLSLAKNPFNPESHRRSSHSQPLASDSPNNSPFRPSFDSYTDPFQSSSHGHEPMTHNDDLLPPTRPFSHADGGGGGSRSSSRRSSVSSSKDLKERPTSLSVNYVPTKFTKLHAPGDHLHKRAKQGGGRDAFATNASRMGMMGTVDDDEGVVFQLGKGGLKKKKPKLRWNRFKWILFTCNTLLMACGIAFLIAAILVWLNVFYQSDVIRVGNRTELILSTAAASFITLTAIVGYAGIVLNNRAFLAVYTLFLWFCLALTVAPGYMTYKQKTFNLEGKINLQWSRNLGTDGRLRIQNALRCCGYFSPYVEATQSPLCYARSNLPGCKNRYLKLERHVLTTWFTISFALVPALIGIIIAGLLCSNHITYRFGKGLTPKRYRLDLGSMAVIMDEYASQIAAQYGPDLANEAFTRSSTNLGNEQRNTLSLPSRQESYSSLAALTTGANAGMTRPTSRFASQSSHLTPHGGGGGSTISTGYNSHSNTSYNPRTTSGLYDPSSDNFDGGSGSRNIDTETDFGNSTRYEDNRYDYDDPSRGYSAYGQPGHPHTQGSGEQGGWAR